MKNKRLINNIKQMKNVKADPVKWRKVRNIGKLEGKDMEMKIDELLENEVKRHERSKKRQSVG